MSISTERYAYELANCTVRIDGTLGDQQTLLGTGFFVGTGRICTCAHVVEGAKEFVVTWQNHRYAAKIERSFKDPDIAMVVAPIQKNPVVAVGDALELYDRVFFYGYTAAYIGGIGSSAEFDFMATASERDPDSVYLKFARGQFSPGFSGSPILNLSTRTVCGMVKRSRDTGSDLGGYAIPMSTLSRYVPEFNVLRARKKNALFSGSTRRDLIRDIVRRLAMKTDNIMYDLVYVAMPLESAAAVSRYAVIVEETAKQGVVAMHSSDHPTLAMRPLEVQEKMITRCNLAIFDLTDEHPDVLYQLGLQAMLDVDEDAVLLLRHTSSERRFGIVPYPVEEYSDNASLRRAVRQAIENL